MGDDQLVETNGKKRPPRIRPRSPPPPPPYVPLYDHFKLVLTWPPVFCKVKLCPNPAPMYLTIHGMWPSSSSRNSDPTDCDTTRFVTKGQWEELYMNLKVQDLLKNTQLLGKPSAPTKDLVQAIHDITKFNPQIRCEKIGQLEYLIE
ncbi:Sc-RNase, partial [Trifolium medium]|nr:Sc-RNase [Trifolium medium]